MKRYYFDGWFHTLLRYKFNFFKDVDEIPNDVELVGTSFYTNNYREIQRQINLILPKTKKLIVNLSEPTSLELMQTLVNNQHVQFYGDAVLNFNANNFKTIVSWFITPENYYATQPWAQSLINQLQLGPKAYKFDCLLGSEKPHRTLVSKLWENSTYKDQILFTYFKEDLNLGIWDIEEPGGYNIEINNTEVSRFSLLPVSVYNQSYFSIVAETTAFNEFNQYTEKVAKPIIAQRPFVAFCGQYYLKNLQTLGFQTFNSLIDESYDNEPNITQRFSMAWDQVEMLCQLDPNYVLEKLNSVLEHNRRVFFNTDWHSCIYEDIGILPIPKQRFAAHHRYE